MNRGFTIIELIVVIVVITTLSAISVLGYNVYQSRASDAQGKSIASAVRAGAENYYNTNNEYPSASLVFGGTPTGTFPANYQPASTLLDVPIATINNSKIKLIPCSGTCSISNTSGAYYLTKTTSDATAARSYTNGSCTYTFPTSDDGVQSYLLAYYSKQDSQWKISRSTNGGVTTSNSSTCPFTEL